MSFLIWDGNLIARVHGLRLDNDRSDDGHSGTSLAAKCTMFALTNDFSPAGRFVLLLYGKQINEVNLRSWPGAAVPCTEAEVPVNSCGSICIAKVLAAAAAAAKRSWQDALRFEGQMHWYA